MPGHLLVPGIADPVANASPATVEGLPSTSLGMTLGELLIVEWMTELR